jgi:hypothetical protein
MSVRLAAALLLALPPATAHPAHPAQNAEAGHLARSGRAECDCWRYVRVGGQGDATLGSVTAPAARTAWAVGSRGSHPLLLRWTGDRWRAARLPLPADTLLTGVSAATPGDGWIVGYGENGTPRTAHWTGTAWQPGRLPGGSGAAFPRAVDARTPSDAWAVGSGAGTPGTAMTWHWDGKTWQARPIPDSSGVASALSSIDARTATDVWAVGGRGAFPPRPLVLHYNGTSWTPRPLPAQQGEVSLSSVTALGPEDAWVVGSRYDTTDRPFAAHWDGRSWTGRPMTTDGRLSSVTPDGHGGIWAAGTRGNGTPLLAHWTPLGWDLSTAPVPRALPVVRGTGSSAEVWALARTPGTDHLWAVGAQDVPTRTDSLHTALTWTNAPRPR